MLSAASAVAIRTARRTLSDSHFSAFLIPASSAPANLARPALNEHRHEQGALT